MDDNIDRKHTLREFFGEAIHTSLTDTLGMRDVDHVEQYLAGLLLDFSHRDRVFAIRDPLGQQVEDLEAMLAEGDVTQNADSFAREREVHKHIGDFLLFWSGVYPEFLGRFHRSPHALQQQGAESYHIVSTFDFEPYSGEAPLFKRLSEDFEMFRIGLNIVRKRLPLG